MPRTKTGKTKQTKSNKATLSPSEQSDVDVLACITRLPESLWPTDDSAQPIPDQLRDLLAEADAAQLRMLLVEVMRELNSRNSK